MEQESEGAFFLERFCEVSLCNLDMKLAAWFILSFLGHFLLETFKLSMAGSNGMQNQFFIYVFQTGKKFGAEVSPKIFLIPLGPLWR